MIAMTIRWCAYCQQFLGERAPFEDFGISHGLCASCARRGILLSPDELAHARRLGAIQAMLYDAGSRGAPRSEAARIVETAVAAGVRPIDILMGFVTPALRRVGSEWEKCVLTVTEEHRFTEFCERVIQYVEPLAAPSDPGTESGAEFLVVCAPGNYHTLGSRVFSLWLKSHGVSAKAVFPGIPEAEVVALLRENESRYLGISMACADQREEVEKMVRLVRENAPKVEIVLGGFALKEGNFPPIPGTVAVAEPLEFFSKIER